MSYSKSTATEGNYTAHNTPAIYGASTPQARSAAYDAQQGQGAAYQHQPAVSASDSQMAAMMAQFQGMSIPASMPASAGMTGAHLSGAFFTTDQEAQAQAQALYAGHYHVQAAAYHQPYPFQYPGAYPIMPFTPMRAGYYTGSDVNKDVPGLDNRRGSYSTTESAPGTPYYGGMGGGAYIADRSPIYSTPSPQQGLSHQLLAVPVSKMPLRRGDIPIDIDMDALVKQPPAIPQAIPACFTPQESQHTLEQSLSNPIFGNRNVYIRGLHPNTDDETLAAYAARFGRVETTKAIIDTSTGACKGFGFAKYFDVRHSELCIRGFYKLGYEVGFARESFNSRLKAEADSTSTNLYVSNLPKDWNEQQLGGVFAEYTVLSSRILRDLQGHSRGVGFARFEDRETCEEVIKKFHGQLVGQERLVLQVRYADTESQKTLKRVTAERRQFRTNEYNVGAYGGIVHQASMEDDYQAPMYPRLAQMNSLAPVQGRHVSKPIHGANWKRDASSTSLSSAGLGFKPVVGGVDQAVKAHLAKFSPAKPTVVEEAVETATSEESESGSDDEGATIQPTSPAVAHGTSSTTASQ